jgi:hemoglobin
MGQAMLPVKITGSIAAQAISIFMNSVEEQIHTVVHSFYRQVRQDDLLGPIFERHIGDDWDEHLEKMCRFWVTVLFQAGTYKGNPMMAHLRVDGLDAHHFDHWLKLFHAKVRQCCEAALTELWIERSTRMRESLERGIKQMRAVLNTA